MKYYIKKGFFYTSLFIISVFAIGCDDDEINTSTDAVFNRTFELDASKTWKDVGQEFKNLSESQKKAVESIK